jgi:REP element-mobilizing transposase RayT
MECIFDKDIGAVLSKNWMSLSNRFSNIVPDVFVVMPNHFHGILKINPCRGGVSPLNYSRGAVLAPQNLEWKNTNNVSLGRENPAPTQPTTLGKIVAYFKYISTKNINNEFSDGQKLPIFQRNYYERIIRNNIELKKIRNYIKSNPKNWDVEKEKIFVPYVGARFSRPIV